MYVQCADPDYFQIASYGDWLVGAESESGLIIICRIDDPANPVHKIPIPYQKSFQSNCNIF